MEGSPVYDAWAHMIQRCENPKNRYYPDYGARGVTVFSAWRADFLTFYRDMGERPSSRHSLGRIDNDGNYEPGNCRWETTKQQMRNRRNTRWLEFNGERRPLGEWAEIKGLPAKIVKDRLWNGWSVEETLTLPYPTNRWARRQT